VKLARATLLTLLALTCVLQCVEGLTFLGVSMIARGAVTAIAFAWIMRRKPEGVFLARFTALSILVSAPIVYVKLHRVDFAVGDLVQGLLLLLPALVVSESDRSN
jgi:hypothetical protein